MAGEHLKNALPFVAASAINPNRAVYISPSYANRVVQLASTVTQEVAGVSGDATALQGESVVIYGRGAVVDVTAAASLGAGADIGVAPASAAFAPIAGASGSARHRVGKALESAAAGETFALYIDPDNLSGIA